MKKGIIIVIGFIVAVLFIKCYKEPTYEAVINCYYSTNGITKGEPVPGCLISIGDKYSYVLKPVDSVNLSMLRDSVWTDANGQYKTTFPYEAFLEVRAKKELIDTVFTVTSEGDTVFPSIIYSGKGKIKLLPNEVATIDILLVRED
jgi:hypothetical protein